MDVDVGGESGAPAGGSDADDDDLTASVDGSAFNLPSLFESVVESRVEAAGGGAAAGAGAGAVGVLSLATRRCCVACSRCFLSRSRNDSLEKGVGEVVVVVGLVGLVGE